jgi:hypothetical protein
MTEEEHAMNNYWSFIRKLAAPISLAASLGCMSANAAIVEYASAVESTNGAFEGSASNTLGMPNGTFIQLAFGSSITLDFGTTQSVSSSLVIYTFDNIAPAFADVAVSDDNASFTILGNISDANGTPGSVTFNVHIPFRYVRVTDDGRGDPSFPGAGFDLDAVGRVSAVPEPSQALLLAFGLLALIARMRSRAL